MADEENTNLDGQENEEVTDVIEEDVDVSDDQSGDDLVDQDDSDSEEQGDDQINQDAVNKKINKVVYEKKKAQEDAAAERQRREEVEAELRKLQEVGLPDIPEIPDYMDPDFATKMKARDDIIVKHAQEASRRESLAQIEQEKANEAIKQDQVLVEDAIKSFDNNADEFKLDKKTLSESQNVVAAYIPGKRDLARYLLSDKDGPLNVMYLSQNVNELEKISSMSEAEAAAYIATKIAPESRKLKPKTTNTPEPAYDPTGNRRVVDDDPMLAGATFK